MRLRPTLEATHAQRYLRPGGPWDLPNLDALLARAPRRDGAQLVDGVRRLDRTEVDVAVAALAGGLRAAGVAHGDVVAWQLPNGIEAVLLSRACWRLGAVAAPLHHRSGAAELDAMLALLEPVVSISDHGLPLAARPGTVAVGSDRWAALCSGSPVTESPATGADLALVQFTSGSTGTPKAVLHSHWSLGAKTVQMVAAHGLGPSDATLVQSPISHISGLLNGVLVPGGSGMRHVLVERWDPDVALQAIRDERVSFMVGPPTVFLSLIDAVGFSPDAVASLRVVSCGGTGVTPEFVTATAEAFGAVVKRSYGCTEAPTVTTSAVGDPLERAAVSDGRPLDDTEIRIVDPDSGQPCPPGTTGEVWVRGPELFAGYALATQTDDAVIDGWFRTGDLGRLDDAGWLSLVGRLKDVIIRGGENVAPAEVERALEQHPSIRQAVVVGVPDDRLGERVAAFVIAEADGGQPDRDRAVGDRAGGVPVELDAATCAAWFDQLGVARFKSPEIVMAVESFPTLSLGKPDRAALRALAAERAAVEQRERAQEQG